MKKIVALITSCLLLMVGCSDVSNDNKSEDQNMNNSIAYTGNLDLSNRVLSSNDKQEIGFNKFDMNAYSTLLVYSNPAISSVQSNLEYINSLCSIRQLRQNSNDENIYYCKFVCEEENLNLYVFFNNDADFTTFGAIDLHVNSKEKTSFILNNVGGVPESIIDGIADVDLPFGGSTKLESIDSSRLPT